MKQFKWPRPPLILGVVLGDTIERYLFISVERYGLTWLARPVVAILFTHGDHRPGAPLAAGHPHPRRPQADADQPSRRRPSTSRSCSRCSSSSVIGTMVFMALRWDFSAKIVPLVVGQRRAGGSRLQPVQRHVPQAGDRDRQPGGTGDAATVELKMSSEPEKDPHGSDVRHRSSAAPTSSSSGRRASSAI